MNYRRCECKWCHSYPMLGTDTDPDDIVELAKHVLECSGPFDDSDIPHTLALAVIELSKKRDS